MLYGRWWMQEGYGCWVFGYIIYYINAGNHDVTWSPQCPSSPQWSHEVNSQVTIMDKWIPWTLNCHGWVAIMTYAAKSVTRTGTKWMKISSSYYFKWVRSASDHHGQVTIINNDHHGWQCECDANMPMQVKWSCVSFILSHPSHVISYHLMSSHLIQGNRVTG